MSQLIGHRRDLGENLPAVSRKVTEAGTRALLTPSRREGYFAATLEKVRQDALARRLGPERSQ